MLPVFAVVGPFVLRLVHLMLGVILLITMKNKIDGLLVFVGGLLLPLCSAGVFMALVVTTSVRG